MMGPRLFYGTSNSKDHTYPELQQCWGSILMHIPLVFDPVLGFVQLGLLPGQDPSSLHETELVDRHEVLSLLLKLVELLRPILVQQEVFGHPEIEAEVGAIGKQVLQSCVNSWKKMKRKIEFGSQWEYKYAL